MNLKRNNRNQVKCALQGRIMGVSAYKDISCYAEHKDIASVMGYDHMKTPENKDFIRQTIDLLEQGKAVHLTSNAGYNNFIPITEDEKFLDDIIYYPDGSVYSQILSKNLKNDPT